MFVRVLRVAFLCLCLQGCVTSYTTSKLSAVERSQAATESFGESVITRNVTDKGAVELYEDGLLSIAWTLQSYGLNFILENKSDQSLKILWDEASYISPASESMGVIHAGVRLIDKQQSQPPSIVARKTKFSDLIYPKDYVFWNSYGGNWEYTALLPGGEAKFTGKTIQVLLPLEVDGVKYEYIFVFTIGEGQPKKKPTA